MTNLSIITATFNVANTIKNCLESVRNQSVDVEHILVDGGSTDKTLEIVAAYKEHLSHVVSEPDNGIYDAMNKGLNLVSGDVVGILNADDYYVSNKTLEHVTNVFANPTVDSCYGDLIYFDQRNPDRIIRYWRSGSYSPNKFYWGWMPPHPTFFVRRSVYEKYGTFNLSLGTAADYEIMLRFILKHQINTKYLPEVLVRMSAGGVSNASLANRYKANRMDRKAWSINGLKPYPWTLLTKPLRKIGQWLTKK